MKQRKTLDGWYSLHLFYAIDFTSLKILEQSERTAMVEEFKAFINTLEDNHVAKKVHTRYTTLQDKS